MVSRLGKDAARSAALMQLTLPGMIFIYYGEELGMHDVSIPKDRVQDPAAGGDPAGQGRDPERTPMQWSADANAGFSSKEPWLPISDDYKHNNVESELADKTSFLHLYRSLIRLRTSSAVLRYGSISVLDLGHRDILAYVRSKEGENERYITLVNFASTPVKLSAPVRQFLLSSHPATKLRDAAQGVIELLPNESALFLE
jgi:alpha-glucosidase